MRDLVVLVPSRGRPESVRRLSDAFEATVTGDSSLLVLVDDDDPRLGEYRYLQDLGFFDLEVGKRLRVGGTLNAVAPRVATDCFAIGFLGDDHVPRTRGWDTSLVASLRDLGSGVAWGNDLHMGRRLPTSVVMTSDIVRTLGYFVMPGAVHLFVDNFWLAIGEGLDRIAYRDDVVIEHLHPFAGKAELDDTYREANSRQRVDEDRRIFEQYVADHLQHDLARLRAALSIGHR